VELWRKEQLLKIIEGYEPKNIYNADETELFIKLPVNETLGLKGGSLQQCKEFQVEVTGSVSLQCRWG
jgi:hypothetical protein